MPTKTKPKSKAKKNVAAAEFRAAVQKLNSTLEVIRQTSENTSLTPPVPNSSYTMALRKMVWLYEGETGSKANQVRLIDFIRWWEEREKQ